ncbi:PEP-CTERM sorting domain-containing protein [Aquisphaera giovannonii]|uniref:PEP-CTERM sorting domain-containing protein n=1 Tax=Aquisphaera giovannonii TaxID=406548 RepID=UPI0011E013D6|nr:PEP-CTERM sorting domain-containing protein [Aquisphaera giovannonii]
MCVASLALGWAVPARADLVISIGDATVAQGGTGTLNVYLSSTADASAPDVINNYAFLIQITANTAGNLAFSSSQGFGYLNDGSYVFFGNSADYVAGLMSPPPVGGTPSTTDYPNDSFVGFDTTNDFSPVALSSSSGPVLLASLSLDASITSEGESFTVSLVPNAGDGSSGSGSGTYFDVVDDGFSEQSAVSYTSTSGTVTITAAVPEPASASLGLIATCLLACGLVRRSSRRR